MIVASSDDGTQAAVIGICRRCINEERGLPESIRAKRMRPGVERALNYPECYLCTVYNDPGAASLAKALLTHRDYKARTLVALGWIPGDCTDFTDARR